MKLDGWLEKPLFQQDGSMKFQQRLVCIAATSLIVVVYLIFLVNVHLVNLQDSEHIKVSLRESPLHLTHYDWQEPDQQKCRVLDNLESFSNLTSLYLRDKARYDTLSNGQYELPTKSFDPDDIPEKLNVILIPHSHNDAGWLRTLEEYYIYTTKKILNNMVIKLKQYPNMTFVWAESVFLSMWWNELEDDTKVHVRNLVKRGQLEIVLGGWVMPDEASTHYVSVIDQLMEGHLWLHENLHVKPHNSWSIDPFGHSGTIPYILKKSGIDNMVIQRIHQATKGALASVKSLEYNWHQPWDMTGKNDILCHVMPYMLYSFQYTCGPDPYVCFQFDFCHSDNPEKKSYAKRKITGANIDKMANFLYQQFRKKSSLYAYNTILVPIGDDFRYDSLHEWDEQYNNYQRLMRYLNSRKDWNINVQFGTVADYFSLLKREGKKKSFPTLAGDFFPYSDQNYLYWTGYYSTRPFDKRFSREVESNLRTADILNTLAFGYCNKWNVKFAHSHDTASLLQQARRHLGLFLHHDAITGTSKDYVMENYESKLLEAYNDTQKVMSMALQTLLTKGQFTSPLILSPDLVRQKFNVRTSQRTISISDSGTTIVVFNPLPKNRNMLISLIVNTDNLQVLDRNMKVMSYQLNPVWISKVSVSTSKFEITFLVELPPLGIHTFLLRKGACKEMYPSLLSVYNSMELDVAPNLKFAQNRPVFQPKQSQKLRIENDFVLGEFDPVTGLLQKVLDKRTGNVTNIQIQFMYYISRGSGAYIFFPKGEANPLPNVWGQPVVRVTEGPLMSKIEVLHPIVHHTVILYKVPTEQGQNFHIQNVVDMHASKTKDWEIIMRMHTDVMNANLQYYSDQNGYQLIKRRTKSEIGIAANYFPMTTMSIIEDSSKRVTVHTGQAHGVASLHQGEIEIMLDRQLMYDDNKGLGQGVTDNKPTLSEFILQIEYRDNTEPEPMTTSSSLSALIINEALQQPPAVFYTTINSEVIRPSFDIASQSLPCDISLVSLKNLVNSDLDYDGTSLILHRRGYKCGFNANYLQCPLNKDVTLSSILPDLTISGARETTLTHLYNRSKALVIKDPLNIPVMELATYKIIL
ncbi:alpha-mannosidase 2-like isoform X1 [Mytilus californianus]|uniref:alpha-mannosidase 2-like isoform X1 n=2 Tax=Mytilus californianus TaxID=6549 RepID=UPI002245A654|nr:alpha-mannosidase 2-like isoform X1 [Mytilus californianus]